MRPNPENDELRLEHIDECIDRILEYTGGGRTAFDASRKTQDAVIRNLQVLAESTQRLSPTLKDTEQSVPWRSIAAFRNVLTHEYLHVNLEIVWRVVEEGLPELATAIKRMLRRVRGPGGPS